MTERQIVIAVDFDGCVTSGRFPEVGEPNRNVLEFLWAAAARGWDVIIHSCRVNYHWPEPARSQKVQEMMDYLERHDVPFTSIWGLNLPKETARRRSAWCFSGDHGKPVADIYLEDRAINPTGLGVDWLTAMAEELVRQKGDPLAYHRQNGDANAATD